jgi:hypothetical protein
MGYKKGYQDGYLKSNGTSYNWVIDFGKVMTWIEITNTLMGDSYTKEEKKNLIKKVVDKVFIEYMFNITCTKSM